jgi:hypothetical protein
VLEASKGTSGNCVMPKAKKKRQSGILRPKVKRPANDSDGADEIKISPSNVAAQWERESFVNFAAVPRQLDGINNLDGDTGAPVQTTADDDQDDIEISSTAHPGHHPILLDDAPNQISSSVSREATPQRAPDNTLISRSVPNTAFTKPEDKIVYEQPQNTFLEYEHKLEENMSEKNEDIPCDSGNEDEELIPIEPPVDEKRSAAAVRTLSTSAVHPGPILTDVDGVDGNSSGKDGGNGGDGGGGDIEMMTMQSKTQEVKPSSQFPILIPKSPENKDSFSAGAGLLFAECLSIFLALASISTVGTSYGLIVKSASFVEPILQNWATQPLGEVFLVNSTTACPAGSVGGSATDMDTVAQVSI